jgi:hypothetical protein
MFRNTAKMVQGIHREGVLWKTWNLPCYGREVYHSSGGNVIKT